MLSSVLFIILVFRHFEIRYPWQVQTVVVVVVVIGSKDFSLPLVIPRTTHTEGRKRKGDVEDHDAYDATAHDDLTVIMCHPPLDAHSRRRSW